MLVSGSACDEEERENVLHDYGTVCATGDSALRSSVYPMVH